MPLLPNNSGPVFDNTETTKDGLPVHTYLHSHGVENEIFRANDGFVSVSLEVNESLPVAHNDHFIILTNESNRSARLFVIEKAQLELTESGYHYAVYSDRPAEVLAERINVDSKQFDHLFALCRKYCWKSSDPQLQRLFCLKEPLLKYLADTEPPHSGQPGILQSDYHAQFYFDDEATFQVWWSDFEKLRAMNSTIADKLSQDHVPHKEMVRAAVDSKNWSKLATELKQKWNIYTPPDVLGAMQEHSS